MNKICIVITIFLCILIYGCRKDSSLSNCTPLPLPNNGNPSFGWNYILDSLRPIQPCFNPNNSNEFIFSYLPNGASPRLCKFNMQTGQQSVIFEGELLSPAQWGKDDWILLNLSDANIWKIKSNGDSLSQLTFTSGNFGPLWNYTYDTIAFYNTSTGNNTTYLINKEGQYLDTLVDGISSGSCWNNPQYMATCGCVNVNLCPPGKDSVIAIASLPSNNTGCGDGIVFTSLNTVVWSCHTGIYQTNIYTHSTKQLIYSCNSKTYLWPSYSVQSNKILWERVIQTPVNNTTLYVESSVVIMNTDGTNEQEIKIFN